MMLMHNAPSSIDFAEAHGQSKIQRFSLTVCADAGALSYRRGKGHIVPSSDLQVVKVNGNGLLGPRQKRLPSRHVRVQPSR